MLSPTRPLPTSEIPKASSRSPGYPNFCPIQLQIGGLTTPSSGSINLLQRLREFRETLPYVHDFIKGYEKGHRWAVRWDAQSQVWEGPEHGSFCPRGAGVHPSGYMAVLSHLGAQRTPYSWGVAEDSSRRRGPPFSPFPAPSTLWRVGRRDENSKLLITALSFWWPASSQESTQSRLSRTKDGPVTQEITRGVGALCREPGAETNMCIF